jgi:WD40 repeat protein
VAVTPDGTEVVSASYDGTLKVWDLKSGEEVRTLKVHTDTVRTVAVTPDGTEVAVSSSDDHRLKVWDLKSGTEVWTLQGHTERVFAVAVTPDGTEAVSGSVDHRLKVWDLQTGAALATFTADGPVRSVAIAANGCIVAGDAGGHVHFLKLVIP